MPGALVRASWGGGGKTVFQSVAARTDSSGRFLLEGLDPVADLSLTALSDGRSSGAAQTVRAGPDMEVKLEVRRSNTVLLAGRVLDSSRKPIAGAEVRLRSQTRASQGQVWRIDAVVFGEQNVLHTDQNGRFQTPIGVPTGLEYEAVITAPDTKPGRTGWLKAGGGAATEFPDLRCTASGQSMALFATGRDGPSRGPRFRNRVMGRFAHARSLTRRDDFDFRA